MKREVKKLLASVVCLAMFVGLLPMNAFALGDTPTTRITPTNATIDATNFPDDNFRVLVGTYDVNKDSVLNEEELATVTAIDADDMYIADLTGIEFFTSLTTLSATNNYITTIPTLSDTVTSIDVSNNMTLTSMAQLPPALESFLASSTGLSGLGALPTTLISLNISNTNIKTLPDLSALTNLEMLNVAHNEMTTLPTLAPNLKHLYVQDNKLTTLPALPETLETLSAYHNRIAGTVDISTNPNITKLDLSYNLINELKLHAHAAYSNVSVSYNYLTTARVIGNTIDIGTQNKDDFVPVHTIAFSTNDIEVDTPVTNLAASVYPDGATNQDIVWSINEDANATLSAEKLTTHGSETLKITATIADGLGIGMDFVETFEKKVVQPDGKHTITLDAQGGTLSSNVMTTDMLGQLATYPDPTPANAGTVFLGWYLSPTDSTTQINPKYRFDASTTIYAHWEYVPVTSITMTSATNITFGDALTVTADVLPTHATNQDIEWAVVESNGTGARINGTTFTIAEPGTVTISATIKNGKTSTTDFTENFTIIVAPAPIVFEPVTNVEMTNSATIILGNELDLEGTVEPANATNKSITWSIKDAGTTGATINNGMFIATSGGKATILATVTNGTTATVDYVQEFSITVTDKTPQVNFGFNSTSIINGVMEVVYGKDDYRISAEGNVTGSGVTYKSSNPDVATVSGNGTVTVVGVGSTTITASATGTSTYAPQDTSYTLRVTKAPLTISVGDYIIEKGETLPTFALKYTGLVNAETAADLDNKYTASTTTDGTVVGMFTIKVNGGTTDSNYTITMTDGKLTVQDKTIDAVVNSPIPDDESSTFPLVYVPTGVTFENEYGEQVNPDDVRLVISTTLDPDDQKYIQDRLPSNADAVIYLDISLIANGEKVQPSDTLSVFVPYTDLYGISPNQLIRILHKQANGGYETIIPEQLFSGLRFPVDSLSAFGFYTIDGSVVVPGTGTGSGGTDSGTGGDGSSGSGNGSDSDDDDDGADENRFWTEVEQAIKNGDDDEIIVVEAYSYTNMPRYVMEALREYDDISLVIEWSGGDDIAINAGEALRSEEHRVFYTFEYLAGIYGDEIHGDGNPSTGGPVIVKPSVTTPPASSTAPAPSSSSSSSSTPAVSESESVAPSSSSSTPQTSSEPESIPPTTGAVTPDTEDSSNNLLIIIPIVVLLLVAGAGAFFLFRKRVPDDDM